MKDITRKITTLRSATASGKVKVGSKATIDAIRDDQVPKGNVLEMARAAAMLGIKNTSAAIPDCHPIPVEQVTVDYELSDNAVEITVKASTVYKTGIEVEVMHGVMVAATTLYDMLKPIEPDITITDIQLLEKKGGKSDFKDKFRRSFRAAVIVCSDSISGGKKSDRAGKALIAQLQEAEVAVENYEIIPDEVSDIQNLVQAYCDEQLDLVVLTGGTGLSPRDVTPEAVRPMLDVEIPGIAEAARNYGQQRTPFSMLSRSVAGLKGATIILALPGSTKGATESMQAIFPYVLHLFNIITGRRHK